MYLLKAELLKLTADYRNYLLNYLLGQFTVLLLVIGLFYSFIVGKDNPSVIVFIFALLFWYYSSDAIGGTSDIISEELMLGTFEQLMMCKGRIAQIFLNRLFVQFILRTLLAIVFFSLAIASFGVWNIFVLPANILIQIAIVFFSSMVGLYAMGLFVASLTLIYKRVGAISSILNYIVLFFTGGIVDFQSIPSVIRPLLHIIPITWGNRLISDIVANENANLLVNTKLWGLVLVVLFWVVISWFAFGYCLQKAKARGNIGSYYF